MVLFHKGSAGNADKHTAGDGQGGDLRTEMDNLAALGKGKCELWVANSVSVAY